MQLRAQKTFEVPNEACRAAQRGSFLAAIMPCVSSHLVVVLSRSQM